MRPKTSRKARCSDLNIPGNLIQSLDDEKQLLETNRHLLRTYYVPGLPRPSNVHFLGITFPRTAVTKLPDAWLKTTSALHGDKENPPRLSACFGVSSNAWSLGLQVHLSHIYVPFHSLSLPLCYFIKTLTMGLRSNPNARVISPQTPSKEPKICFEYLSPEFMRCKLNPQNHGLMASEGGSWGGN